MIAAGTAMNELLAFQRQIVAGLTNGAVKG